MIAAAMTGGDVVLRQCEPRHLDAVIHTLQEAGVGITPVEDGLRVVGPPDITSINVKTIPYPGFPTDLQAQMIACMSVARGISVVTETVFENRFMHVYELMRMGADIVIEGPSAIIKGVPKLRGAPVMATDLRASASLVIAGLIAEGTTELSRVYHIDRGYERIEEKLSRLGADIRRVKV
jgi:UDP-N-acetylglucosamine 1-carboxyvinyltransferase